MATTAQDPPIITPPIRDISSVTEDPENNILFYKNISITLRNSSLPIRANAYLPLTPDPRPEFKTRTSPQPRYPVLVTYGPYGKDIPYSSFHPASFAQLNPAHRSPYSAWETPDPVFWTRHGYAVVRVDERGSGQSPGFLDTMSAGTSECFFDVVEWAADQSWSSGKVGLLGVSYFAGTQWRVAARRPKGLSAIVPWEGMSDYYRDRCRHGGILSNTFIDYWWNRQVLPTQYGLANRSKLTFPPNGTGARDQEDTIEGDLPGETLETNRRDQTVDNACHRFRDEEYYAARDFQLEDIEVPVLSAANWGGILLHLRGNVEGFTWASSKFKYLRFITGRHDLPFYYEEEVEVQRSFLDAFLKGEDRVGWSVEGKAPPVTVTLRKGDVGVDDPEKERAYEKRTEEAWPIPRTKYTKFHLGADGGLSSAGEAKTLDSRKVSYQALGTLQSPQAVTFTTAPFEEETEITGHITARLNVSMTTEGESVAAEDKDIDLFLTLRHLAPDTGEEIHYTGTAGDPVPLCKGWLRTSLRRVLEDHARHRAWLPQREYASTDVEAVQPGTVYKAEVEMWPTNVVVEKGGRIVLEVASGDTQGSGLFRHEGVEDRNPVTFAGLNHIHFGGGLENYVTLPIIPSK